MNKKITLLASGLLVAAAAQAQFSIQKVVLEEFTGAWCQYCPDGAVIAEQIDQNQPNAIVYAVHQGDAMEVPVGTDMISFYQPAYPQGLVNRNGAVISRGQWSSTVGTELQGASVVTVAMDSVSYNQATRELYVLVRASFTGPASGDMRFNLALFEDNITGTGSGYNQVNAFNTVPGHAYYQAGNPIVGFNHRHVLKTMLSGAWGESGIIASTVNFGSTFTKEYTYTLPANWKAWDVGMAAIVQRYGPDMADREIINAEEFHLNTLVVANEESLHQGSDFIQLAPNPSTGRTRVSFSLSQTGQIRMEVINMLGQHVATLGEGVMNEGLHTLNWNGTNDQGQAVENGMYIVRLITEHGQSASQRMLIAR